MNITMNDLSVKLVYIAILAGLVLAFTDPMRMATPHGAVGVDQT